MELSEYFETAEGTGVLATADNAGKVDAAIYGRPHVMEDGSVAFIMRDRLSHANIESNPHAVFLFIEKGPGYSGKRLFLTRLREEKDTELLYELRRRTYPKGEKDENDPKFLVFFKVDKQLPLVGE
jgi:hypothetical protein